jgi:hypothetical protein
MWGQKDFIGTKCPDARLGSENHMYHFGGEYKVEG